MLGTIDIYVGIIEKKETVEEAEKRVFETILEVASGLITRSEINKTKSLRFLGVNSHIS